MLLGIVAVAAGINASLGHFTEALDAPVALAVGVGIYLLGQMAFHYVMRIDTQPKRLIFPVAAVATAALGVYMSAAVQLATLVILLVVVILAEVRPMRQRQSGLRSTSMSA